MRSVFPSSSARLRSLGSALALLALGCGSPGAVAAEEPKLVIEDLKLRAEAGDRTATRALGDAYCLGRGVEQDFAEAARWYLKLAQQGDVRAQTTIGLMYARGYGVARDPKAAHHWWSFAAAANDPGAQFNLGLLHANGDGLPQDYARAAEWYAKAANRAHIQAQYALGTLYRDGLGVEKDPVRAYYWMKIAALQGDETAAEALKRMGATLTAEQVAGANAQAEDWIRRAKKAWQVR